MIVSKLLLFLSSGMKSYHYKQFLLILHRILIIINLHNLHCVKILVMIPQFQNLISQIYLLSKNLWIDNIECDVLLD